jgi:hypothetical protein
MLKSATFDHLSGETFALRFGILSHAAKEEQAACDDGNDDNKENQRLPTLPGSRRAVRALIVFE